MTFETQVIQWLGEEVLGIDAGDSSPVINLQQIVNRLPEYRREADPNLTDSMILSFETFDRASVYRTIRMLQMRGFVQLVEEWDESEGRVVEYVALSPAGIGELTRLKQRGRKGTRT